MSANINARAQQFVNVARSIRGCVTKVVARIDALLRLDACLGTCLRTHLQRPHERGGWRKYQPSSQEGSLWLAHQRWMDMDDSMSYRRPRFTTRLAPGRLAIPVPVLGQ